MFKRVVSASGAPRDRIVRAYPRQARQDVGAEFQCAAPLLKEGQIR